MSFADVLCIKVWLRKCKICILFMCFTIRTVSSKSKKTICAPAQYIYFANIQCIS